MKHRCLAGPPSEPCQSYQWKCLFERRNVVMAAPALLPRHSQDPRSQKCHHRATARLQSWRKWGKVQIRATVALRVWQVKQKGEQALICDLSHVTFLWLKALTELGTRLHTRALSHGNAPVPAQAVPQKQGYRITQVSSLFPFLNFYSAKVMHFRESIKFG